MKATTTAVILLAISLPVMADEPVAGPEMSKPAAHVIELNDEQMEEIVAGYDGSRTYAMRMKTFSMSL